MGDAVFKNAVQGAVDRKLFHVRDLKLRVRVQDKCWDSFPIDPELLNHFVKIHGPKPQKNPKLIYFESFGS